MLATTLILLVSLLTLGRAAPAPGALDGAGAVELVERGHPPSYGYGKKEYKPTIHSVTVGKGMKLRYDPEYVYAKKGDVVLFEYFPNNHTVTQSSFKYPCSKLTNEYGVETGIDSSFNFATTKTDGYSQPSFAFTVQTEPDVPLWFYCRQTVKVPHCAVGGMTFAINPPKYGNTFEKFQQNALALGKKWKGKDERKGKGKGKKKGGKKSGKKGEKKGGDKWPGKEGWGWKGDVAEY